MAPNGDSTGDRQTASARVSAPPTSPASDGRGVADKRADAPGPNARDDDATRRANAASDPNHPGPHPNTCDDNARGARTFGAAATTSAKTRRAARTASPTGCSANEC